MGFLEHIAMCLHECFFDEHNSNTLICIIFVAVFSQNSDSIFGVLTHSFLNKDTVAEMDWNKKISLDVWFTSRHSEFLFKISYI